MSVTRCLSRTLWFPAKVQARTVVAAAAMLQALLFVDVVFGQLCADLDETGLVNSASKKPFSCKDLADRKFCNHTEHGKDIRQKCPVSCKSCDELEIVTVEDTDEWKACVANPTSCTVLDLQSHGLRGTIPSTIGDFVNLKELMLNDNLLNGPIPISLGKCVKLVNLYLFNNNLSGGIPSAIGNCSRLEHMWLFKNDLSGPIPDSIKHLTRLTELKLQNNNLDGMIPGNAVWRSTTMLTTLYLQGNNFTGSVPIELFEMVSYSNYPFKALNVGDNQLSGPVPTDHTTSGTTSKFRLTDHFSELWLLGNNWDGGPCVALCGGINTGSLDDVKREASKKWANECLVDVQSHKDLPDSDYSVDELGRCSFKSPTCAKANYYVASRSIVSPDCKRCPVHTFQPNSSHTETKCYNQPTCGTGEFISVDNDDLRIEIRTCDPCTTNTYQSAKEHRLTECIAQPFCTAGEYITGTDKTSTIRRICNACPAGHYQDNPDHRETSCMEQQTCPTGTEFTTTVVADRLCNNCEPNEYQDSSDANIIQTTCIEQTYCGLGQKMTKDTKTERRQCIDCQAGKYQDKNKHRSTTCIIQPKCGPGMLFRPSLYENLTCYACPPNTYQNATNHTETTCIPQQGCLPQHKFVGNKTTEGRCEPCKEGTIQPNMNHFDLCFDPSSSTTVCNNVGIPNADTGECECTTAGYAGPNCEYSNAKTCNNLGIVSYDPKSSSASCSGCTDQTKGIGDRCLFSNAVTCKDFGVVTVDGECDWKPEVLKCPPGYYFNPPLCHSTGLCKAGIRASALSKQTTKPPKDLTGSGEDTVLANISDVCSPCSPGQFASETKRRVQCTACPNASIPTNDTPLEMLQNSEPASTSASECFAKFQSAADRQFCYGNSSITSGSGNGAKPLSRITSYEDCSIAATSLGFEFAGEFVLPYSGCVYDKQHQEARFYVDQSKYEDVASARSDNDNTTDDRPRRRSQQHHQNEQQQPPKQQEAQLQRQQRGRQRKQLRRQQQSRLLKANTPLCELYVCPDPDNRVEPLTADDTAADKFPSCEMSAENFKNDLEDEKLQFKEKFLPACGVISGATLVASYVTQCRYSSSAGRSFTFSQHVIALKAFLRVFDMLTDFGFVFISLHGGAFLEAYGDSRLETNPYEEPNVAAFLFVSIFCTVLGLFLTPFDLWAMSRPGSSGMSMIGVAIVLSITLFEDVPQLVLASIYIITMSQETDEAPDKVSVISLCASALSMLFNVATVMYYTRKLRVQDPTGWWKIEKAVNDSREQAARNAAVEAENAALKRKIAFLEKKQARSTISTVSNPVFGKTLSSGVTKSRGKNKSTPNQQSIRTGISADNSYC